MKSLSGSGEEYIQRKKKEDLAFLVVRFLAAYDRLNRVALDFQVIERRGSGFRRARLFEQIRDLEEGLVFDIKEKAHFLFRDRDKDADACRDTESGCRRLEELLVSSLDEDEKRNRAREIFLDIRRSLIGKAIDSYVGTGFHLFMILRESVYQLEHYVPLFQQERRYIRQMESLAARFGYQPGGEELEKLARLKEIDKQIQEAAGESRALARRSLESCQVLFQKTAEMIRLRITESGQNEVLVLNLLREKELVESIYGPGSLEEIFSQMLRYSGLPGASGMEKALAFVRDRCGNIEGIPRQTRPLKE